MQQIAKELGKIWALEEEIKVDKDLGINVFEGDRNTTYFQVVANQIIRKKTIEVL
jgi:hypothetical protein